MTLSPAPIVHPINWPDAKTGPWLIQIHLARVAGRMECVGVEILSYARDPHHRHPFLPMWDDAGAMDKAEPIRAVTLREIPLGTLVKDVLDSLPHLIKATEAYFGASDRTKELLEAAEAARSGRGGRKGHPAKHYAEVAQVYATAWAGGAHPTVAVAEHKDWSHIDGGPVSRGQAAKWVARARDLGFLEPTTRGRPGGVRTG